jgi:hypothetical protein
LISGQLLEMDWHREYDWVDIEQDDPDAPDGWYDDDDYSPEDDEELPDKSTVQGDV